MRDDSLSTIEDLLQKPECVGMGEIGLDYNRNFSPKDKQKEVFEKQVRAGGARCWLEEQDELHTLYLYEQ